MFGDRGFVVVDPVSLTVGGVVAALVAKAMDKAGDSVVDAGGSVLTRLVRAVRDRFASRGDADGIAALARMEDPPVGERQLVRLTDAIDAQATADGGDRWVAELQQLIDEAQASGVEVGSVVQQVWGNYNVAIANVLGSTISVNQPPTDR